jgi:hypothetical protein
VTASPGIVVISVSMDEGDMADLVAGSAAKVAVLANNVSAVAKRIRFIWFDLSKVLRRGSLDARAVPSALGARRCFSGGMPEDQISGVQFRSFAAKINAAAGIVMLVRQNHLERYRRQCGEAKAATTILRAFIVSIRCRRPLSQRDKNCARFCVPTS